MNTVILVTVLLILGEWQYIFEMVFMQKIIETEEDQFGRFLWLKVLINGQAFGLLNIYAPNTETEQLTFFDKIRSLLEAKRDKNVHFIIGGDFNMVRNFSKDKRGGQQKSRPRVVQQIENILEEFSLVDIWRAKNPWLRQYTWAQKVPPVACRLDMWLIPNQFLQITKFAKIVNSVATDHRAVVINISGENYTPRGPGYWKLNTTVLQEAEYIHTIKNVISEIKKQNETDNIDPRIHWEEIKCAVRAASIQYCKTRARKKREREKYLTKKLQELEQQLYDLNPDIVQEYDNIKKEFENLYDEKAKGAMLRSRARWIAQGEKNTKYFFGLEKRNFTMQTITQLDVGKKDLIENPKEIQGEIFKYYKSLYTSKVADVDAPEYDKFFDLKNFPRLSVQDAKTLQKPINLIECESAIREMADSKSPGCDGLPVEFYKKFWTDVKDDLFKAYTHGLAEGELYYSQTRGIIRLLPKPLRNLFLLKNQRPITLLCADYKILSKVLANRLKKSFQL